MSGASDYEQTFRVRENYPLLLDEGEVTFMFMIVWLDDHGNHREIGVTPMFGRFMLQPRSGQMPIRVYLDPTIYFRPDTVKAMGEAFEAACAFMAIDSNEPQRREMVARLIITLARADNQAGAPALRERAVKLLSGIESG